MQIGAVQIHVAATEEALRKKERQDETQFTTRLSGKTSLGPSYVVLKNLHSQLVTRLMPYYAETGPLIA